MNIGIDCRLSGSKHAGIGRYIERLVINLIEQNLVDNLTLFFFDQEQSQSVLKDHISRKNIKIVIAPISHYSIEEQIKLPKIFKSEKLDLLHVPHFNVPLLYSGKIVVTIHDLLWHEFKGGNVTTLSPLKYFLKYFFYKMVTRAAIFKAETIIVPAETIKETVSKFYPRARNKIIITKEGGKIWKNKPEKLKKLKKTLLYVGSLYPHKNIKIVLRALKSLSEYKLMITGSRNIFRDNTEEYVNDNQLSEQVTFLGFIDDEKLNKKYSQVTALIQPSFSEGFGLTGVEAMSLGTPILASDIPIFNEIYQDAAFYFSPFSTSSLINAVHELEKGSDEKVAIGIKLSKTYDWAKMAKETGEIYNNLLKNDTKK